MPLEKTDQIDVVSMAEDGGWRLVLGVYDDEWKLPNADWLLQEKLNAYAAYALEGQMQEDFPASAGKPVSIIIRPEHAPVPAAISSLIKQAATILAKDGLTVTVEPLPAAEAA